MKTVVLIMAHKNPGQLARLCRVLQCPDTAVFIHLDARANMGEYAEVEGAVFIRNRFKLHWGGFSIVRAILSSVREIIAEGTEFDYLHLISGQDYPIISSPAVAGELALHPGRNYLGCHKIDPVSPGDEHLRRRYERYHLFTDRKFLRKIASVTVNTLHPFKRRPPLTPVYKGSMWFTLTRECLEYVIRFCDGNPDYVRSFRATSCPDEIFFQTIIMNSPFAALTENNNHRFIKWTARGANPDILTLSNYDEIVSSGCWFARKFEEDDSVLDRLPVVTPGTRE